MEKRKRLEAPLPGATLYWLLAALAWTLVPHLSRLPLWITVLAFSMGFMRLVIYRRNMRLPPRWIVLFIAVAGTVGVFAQYGTLLGKNAGVALLTLMLAFKLLELRRLRDTMLVIFLGYFLVITNLFFSQEILLALYLLVAVWMLTATLMELTHPDTEVLSTLKYSGQLLLQALPVMLVLFLLFPRVSGPLWGLPKDAASGTTGLSDSMEPGSISQLSQSNAVAFRVDFDRDIPTSRQRYWRGPVFWYTNGRRWRPKGIRPEANEQVTTYRTDGTPVQYTVTLEPHQQLWLFALDLPVQVETAHRVTDDYQVLAKEKIRDVRRYRATSYLEYTTPDLAPGSRRRALQLPNNVSHRTRQLVHRWMATARHPREVVNQALQHFHNQPYVYTLNPPLLGGNPVDEFLFETRRGFCEHYAAAFTTLMRVAGIPTRIVTGYQGGEINPIGNYLIVRQSDAHAWAEVHLPGEGWVRVDPTAAVAPQRIEMGINNVLQEVGAPVRFQLPASNWLIKARDQIRYLWDGVQNGWNRWVLGYGPELQRRFLELVGLGSLGWQGIALTLLTVVALLLGWVAYTLLKRDHQRPDPLLECYQHFCNLLATKGVARKAHEGPMDYAARVSEAYPEMRHKVTLITRLYVALRYGSRPQAEWLRTLQQQVREFRP